MEPMKRIEVQTTEEGCNVTHVTHEDGSEAITLDTGRFPVLSLVDAANTAELLNVGRRWP